MKKRRLRLAKKTAVIATIWAAIALTIAGIAYSLRSPEAITRAQGAPTPPGADATPQPGVTPDTTKPFWYIPYLNQERDLPKFDGTIAGVRVNSTPVGVSGFSICPGSGLDEVPGTAAIDSARNAGALRIDDRLLPAYVKSAQVPDVWRCEASIADVTWVFSVEQGSPGVDKGGGTVTVLRTKGRSTAATVGSAGRWKEQLIAGRPGLAMTPILVVGDHVLGQCLAASVDEKTNVLTQVIATGGTTEFCTAIAEEVLK